MENEQTLRPKQKKTLKNKIRSVKIKLKRKWNKKKIQHAIKARSRWRAIALALILGIIMLAIGFATGFILKSYLIENTSDEESKLADKVTIVQIEHTLKPISELSTYLDNYTGNIESDDARQLFNKDIPFTKNHVDISYSGVIKVGYNISEINISVDDKKQIIFITLPEPQIHDNYIILDTLEFNNENNFLNPIEMEDLKLYFDGIQELELEKSKEEGIMEKAEKHMKSLVTNALAEFKNYEVIFQ